MPVDKLYRYFPNTPGNGTFDKDEYYEEGV